MYDNLLAVINRGVYKQFLKVESERHEDTTTLGTTLLKKRLWHICFPVDFAKCLRT